MQIPSLNKEAVNNIFGIIGVISLIFAIYTYVDSSNQISILEQELNETHQELINTKN